MNNFSVNVTRKFAIRQYDVQSDSWEWLGVYVTSEQVERFYQDALTSKRPRELLDFVEVIEKE